MVSAKKVCPSCGREYFGPSALSRYDNSTEICPECGLFEALNDYVKSVKKETENKEELK